MWPSTGKKKEKIEKYVARASERSPTSTALVVIFRTSPTLKRNKLYRNDEMKSQMKNIENPMVFSYFDDRLELEKKNPPPVARTIVVRNRTNYGPRCGGSLQSVWRFRQLSNTLAGRIGGGVTPEKRDLRRVLIGEGRRKKMILFHYIYIYGNLTNDVEKKKKH